MGEREYYIIWKWKERKRGEEIHGYRLCLTFFFISLCVKNGNKEKLWRENGGRIRREEFQGKEVGVKSRKTSVGREGVLGESVSYE